MSLRAAEEIARVDVLSGPVLDSFLEPIPVNSGSEFTRRRTSRTTDPCLFKIGSNTIGQILGV